MTVLLDIDGVLVTASAWRPAEQHPDGFLKFNAKASHNLARLIDETHAAIVLTTSHRINYSVDEWKKLLATRGIHSPLISKINDVTTLAGMADRATEIGEWVSKLRTRAEYVVLDDDLSINGLPLAIKSRCVKKRWIFFTENKLNS